MKSKDITAVLMAAGWCELASSGSHVLLKHLGRPGRVTVLHPKRDIPIGTLKSIEKQSGVKLR
jgi:predicted RNA binding protein YcfA (HicA-like mRNA interferase family)